MLLALLLALSGAPALAQSPDPAPGAAADATPTAAGWTAELRAEYLAGERIRVPLTVRNDGTAPLTVPDLERRPWLVDFAFDAGKGELEHRRTKAPATDPGQQLTVSPRGQRRTLLEVPTSGAMKAGDYTLLVSLLDDAGAPSAVARRAIRIAPSHPVSADLSGGVGGADRTQLQSVWLHKAAEGFDLYLHVADGRRPDRELGSFHLAHLDREVAPRLARARGADVGNRHVVWMQGPRAIGMVQLQGLQLREAPRAIELPWPTAELAAAPLTDAAGALHVPLWIPAPKGDAGELRVLTIGERGRPSFRRLARFDERPTAVRSVVDDAGTAQIAVVQGGALDLYTVRGDGGTEPLPVPGRRLLRVGEGSRIRLATFGVRPAEGAVAGGLALMALVEGPEGWTPTWVGLQGGTPRPLAPYPVAPGQAPLALVPQGLAPPALIVSGAGGAQLWQDARRVELPVSLQTDWGVVAGADGAVWLRRAVREGPVAVSRP